MKRSTSALTKNFLALTGFAAIALIATRVDSIAAQTIVGRWAPDPAQCTPVGGMIGIGPMEIVADEFQCRFGSVARVGDVVTWTGSCGFPTPPEPAKVVARLAGGTLRVSINGANNGVYRRCH